ncbi:MAG: YARHG domain-containing protein [Clostridia bacterium]|nr:YARHG domain-containing protein [Clostridia bacterium]
MAVFNRKKRRTKTLVGVFCGLILASVLALCAVYFGSGRHLQTIDLSNYAYLDVSKQADGSYSITLDYDAVVEGERLPRADRSGSGSFDESRYPELGLLKSVGFGVALTEDGQYQVSTVVMSDTLSAEQVASILKNAGLKLTNTLWSGRAQTRERGAVQSLGAPGDATREPSADPRAARSAEPGESATPETSSSATPEESATPTPELTSSLAPTATPTAGTVINTDTTGCITSLYGYDQTALRKAIRAAKESYYSSAFRESEVAYNYFIVRRTETAEYANCFRLVLKVTTGGGTEYMVADVYNIRASTAPTSGEVVIKTYTGSTQARGTDDFNSSLYTVYTLNGGSMVFSENAGASPFNSDGLVFDNSLEEYVTTAQLWNIPATTQRSLLSLLGYARNEIFARCGHQFRDTSAYTTHFSAYDWYQPTGSVSYNEIGARYPRACTNIDTIKELEDLIKVG